MYQLIRDWYLYKIPTLGTENFHTLKSSLAITKSCCVVDLHCWRFSRLASKRKVDQREFLNKWCRSLHASYFCKSMRKQGSWGPANLSTRSLVGWKESAGDGLNEWGILSITVVSGYASDFVGGDTWFEYSHRAGLHRKAVELSSFLFQTCIASEVLGGEFWSA